MLQFMWSKPFPKKQDLLKKKKKEVIYNTDSKLLGCHVGWGNRTQILKMPF